MVLTKTIRRIVSAVLASTLVMAATATHGEELNFGTRIPDTNALIKHLAPKDKGATPKYRGIEIGREHTDVLDDETARQEIVESGTQAEPNAASLQVLFAFDSYELTPAAIEQLHPLGMALQSTELAGLSFLLEGHTDAVGPNDYNLSLSQRRALSIKNHLIQNYQVPSAHLQAVGLGEEKLLMPDQPASAQNRRVRIVGAN